jgi:hypothetical protein
MSNFFNQKGVVIAALLLALGMASCGYFIGNMLYKERVASNIASVKGLAEREVKADTAIWNASFEVSATTLPEAYASANAAQDKVVTFLTKTGFANEEMSKQAFSVSKHDVRDNSNKLVETSYSITGAVVVRSSDVDKMEKAAQSAGVLVGEGVILTNSSPQYVFTKLNEIKPEMLGEATRNARIAAEQFAKDANARVGNVRTAEQGAFNFSGRDDTDEYSGNEANSIYKKVRVVTTISFYLKD